MQDQELASIKKLGDVEYITKEEMNFRVQEMARCKRDIKYFAEKYFKIINLDTGLTTIKLYPKQHELLDFLINEDRQVILAARQSSKTTTYTIFALWYTMFFPDKKIMLLANKLDTVIEIVGRIRMAYEYLPKFLKCGVATWNKGEIVFGNKSAIKGFAASSDAARGFSANCVIWDEAAFTPNNIADKIFTSIYPTISSSKNNSKFIMVSTPNGVDQKNIYYVNYMKAMSRKKGQNSEGWKIFRFDWWDVPGRDEAWKRKTIESIGERRFRQEFGNEFLDSQTYKKLIPDDVIEKFRMRLSEYKSSGKSLGKDIPIDSMDKQKTYTVRIYHEFDPTRTYLASGDCGEGVGGDSSVLYIWDITNTNNIKLCLKFSNNRVTLIDFAYVTKELLKLYANPFLAIESNGIGVGYIEQLRRVYEYDNIVRLNREGGFGINSHQTIKSRACMWTQEMLTTKGFDFEIQDAELIDEMTTFIKKDTAKHNIFAAIGDNHDDHIMSMIWMMFMLHEENVERYFVVVDYFQSSLEKNYPKIIAPLGEYSQQQLYEALNDPIYKDFINYKIMMDEKYREALEHERAEIHGDKMQYIQQLQQMSKTQIQDLRSQRRAVRSDRCLFSIGGSGGYYGMDDGPCW